jgi:hypothetical protein
VKNFPHQINQLPTLNDAVRVFADLTDRGQDVSDDGIVGDALARAGVYNFRNQGSRSIEKLLAAEHQKSPSNQGTRTCARDLRRFFRLLRFIEQDDASRWRVTGEARALLTLTGPSDGPQRDELWRRALIDLTLEDEDGTSHPYRILLRLVAEMPGIAKPYSGLCLEAVDDSPAEFGRISRIASQPDPKKTMAELAGASMAADAIKILPSLAEQLGDISNNDGRLTITSRVADVLFDARPAAELREAVRNLTRRPFVPRHREVGATRRRGARGRFSVRRYDPDLVGERFDSHEDCLDRFSEKIPAAVQKFHAVYDLLIGGAENALLLVEAKTIRGDERAQVRTALGQLCYYEHFEVRPLYPNHAIFRLLLTDRPVSADLCEYLTHFEIGVAWVGPDAVLGGSELGLRQLEQFGVG